MPIRSTVLAAVIWVLVTGGVARAEEEESKYAIAKELASGTVRNVRRKVALGPTLGVFSAYTPYYAELHGGLSFGLELELFRTWVPAPTQLLEVVQQKMVEKLAAVIRDKFGGVRPDAATVKRLTKELAGEVTAEVRAELRANPPLLERPLLSIFIEANYLLGTADWIPRIGGSFGIGPVSFGPTLSVRFGDDYVARLGGEISIHLLPTKSPRSPVLDLLLRGDFELHRRSSNDDQISLGVRVLFDII